jgi:hypothetical protein
MSEGVVLLTFFGAIVGGIIGLACGGLWWATATLFGFPAPQGEDVWLACAALGAIGLPLIGGTVLAVALYRDGR